MMQLQLVFYNIWTTLSLLVLMLNKVLPHLNTLSKIFQKDLTRYSCLKPSLEYTKAMIQDIQTNYDVVKDLSDHVASDGPYAALGP